MDIQKGFIFVLTLFTFFLANCQSDVGIPSHDIPEDTLVDFYFGADLSYVNQIIEKEGKYIDKNQVISPYKIFKDHGANLVRLRLWHNPEWTKEIYAAPGQSLYNDLYDVEKAIRLSKEQGMEVLLDLHYSDNWADPGKQEIPKAWQGIQQLSVLKDSVYQYTFKTLSYLNNKGLMPELVQIGNEINCGMLYTNAPGGFPACNVCDGKQWQRLGEVINTAIKAVRDVAASSALKTRIILHVADPKNVEWWFDNVTGTGVVTDYDIIGFSYYPLWHTTVGIDALSGFVSKFKTKFGKPVMILETAYPWTSDHHDDYKNHFGGETPLAGYSFSVRGHLDLLKKLTQEVIDGGGSGIIYWEPAWISVPSLKDQWGTGSSWENNTFFDFEGGVIQSIDYMNYEYLQ